MHWLHLVWRIIRWPLGILVVLYIGVVIFSIPHALEKIKTEETVARIHSQKLTIENVNGEHLPPPPDPAQVDATVEGIDANMNGIRDDVEIAIFEKYPNSAKIRAAELQYAMEFQNEMTSVFNSETLVATIQEEGRGYSCINDTVSSQVPEFTDLQTLSEWLEVKENADLFNREHRRTTKIADSRVGEVEDLILNTPERKEKYKDNYDKYMTSFGTLSNEQCDLDLHSLSD